ncbi:hypothetical protein JX265_007473 [Neoarthrinium moseri]|uniref:Uncharacterized protein n=1 Tax=Neoarthrinium moseri TaxID=1658444 RepID=A0A9P9WK79_9PEZI|nr:uncharacterized protein JN550_009829 [Neoarthrinium moseri]KAI1841380.1 hypothetical protein JX266_012391 [Neoarthrinium moseri]KAI1863093.1 hypothetical protein JN550_009829 [Neoarthrinium moseri]KAI1867671.1 hypothetical protein JX265_007473 [Neoarthrinium moseri]
MPFFSSRKPEDEVVHEPAPVEEPKRHGLFGSRRERSVSPTSTMRSSTTTNSHNTGTTYHTSASSTHSGGVFRRSTDASSGRRSLLSRSFGHGNNVELDPSIVQARERVMAAEKSEHDADRALEAARIQVREARAEVKRLELEAAEEAKRAKIKQFHAREVSKRGKQLGRHDL